MKYFMKFCLSITDAILPVKVFPLARQTASGLTLGEQM